MASDPQYALPLIEHSHRGVAVPQRAKDGYVNATAMCKAAGKNWADYNRIGPTRAFFEELSSEMGLPITELVQSVSGGIPSLQGTWVHLYVAINLGQWLSPQFSVQVSKWVTEWIAGGPQIVERMPYHLRRYVANMSGVPRTHFSVLQELTYGLIAPMEAQGYTLPDNMLPDISQGRMFSDWLRKRGIDPSTFPSYAHRYEDGRVVQARLYPNELIADFRAHFQTVWLPQRCRGYFEERDPKALPYLPALIEGDTPPRLLKKL
jgi:KilA-N domain